MVTAVDDHSRYCVIAKVAERATSRTVCLALAEALARFGVPEEIITDDGKQFTDRFGTHGAGNGEVLFDKICRKNRITHRLTAPASRNQEPQVAYRDGVQWRHQIRGRCAVPCERAGLQGCPCAGCVPPGLSPQTADLDRLAATGLGPAVAARPACVSAAYRALRTPAHAALSNVCNRKHVRGFALESAV